MLCFRAHCYWIHVYTQTWTPYKATSSLSDSVVRNLNSSVSEKDRNLYTIKPVSLSDIHSIRRHVPALGWQYIIIVLSSGDRGAQHGGAAPEIGALGDGAV
ncbi:hypothetical protein KSP39_PZI010533 [Platanthera zijinensis]|uniref:Uncharacterized protein n=1 Tax=Platanthera zijinensis TaxID=2320716 RepID=A0AAP0BIV7_9ASPA